MALSPEEIRQRLTQRYGGQPFDPSGGQTQMGWEEYLDRHPALAQLALKDEAAAKARWTASTSEQGGQAFQAKNPNWGEMAFEPTSNQLQQIGAGVEGGYTTPEATTTERKNPNGGFVDSEDYRPRPGSRRPEMSDDQRAKGRTYREFVKSRGGKSTPSLAATWSAANDKKLNAKMKASAAGRRIAKKKAKDPESTSGNTQQAH